MIYSTRKKLTILPYRGNVFSGVELIINSIQNGKMADKIDKALPTTKTTVEIPGEVEIEEAIQENVKEVDAEGKPV